MSNPTRIPHPPRRRATAARALGGAAVLILMAGTCYPAAAQEGEDLRNAARERAAALQNRQGVQPGAQPIGRAANPAEAPNAALGSNRPGADSFTFNFPDQAVQLLTLTEALGQFLGINIIADQGLQSQTVVFQAPFDVPRDQLLTLLSQLVEDRGFALTRDDLGIYHIRPGANVAPNFDDQADLSTTRFIPTPLVKPSALVQTITTNLGQGGAAARLTPFDELGVLMVTATPRTVDLIEEIVERVLEKNSAQVLQSFLLQHVAADYAIQRINTLNGQLGGAGVAQPGNAAPPGGGASVGVAGSLSNLSSRMFADQGNAIIFRGSLDEGAMLQQLVDLVDRVTPLIARRYSVGAVASEVADAAEQLGLGAVRSAARQGGQGGSSNFAQPGVRGQQVQQQVATSGFLVDSERGSFTYFGTESQHEIVQALIDDFSEQQVGAQVEIEMYKLENAEAGSVAEILEQLIEDPEARQGSSPFLPGSGQPAINLGPGQDVQLLPEGSLDDDAFTVGSDDVIIVADEDRNQIVIKANERLQRQLARVIRDLDQRQPQVNIKAQIVSVTSGDDFNWAFEWQFNPGDALLFTNFGLSTPTTGDDGQPTGNKIVPSDASGITTALIKSDYVPFIINTLQSEANARIESTPQVLVRDNQTGDVSSQREEPFSTTSQGTSTTVTGQGGTASAGTTLNVTPRISSGGYLSLEYSIELSSFDGTGVAGLQPPRQTENYNSSVQVPSDTTIVVGGFTLMSESRTESGIPILKDIPLLGNLFKTVGKSQSRTTIFVFITPTIMDDPDFLDLRLATEGPLADAGIEGVTPRLEPATIPIMEKDLSMNRLVPADRSNEFARLEEEDAE